MTNKPCGNCHKDHQGQTICGDGVFGKEMTQESEKTCDCGCHTSPHSDEEMRKDGCDLCYVESECKHGCKVGNCGNCGLQSTPQEKTEPKECTCLDFHWNGRCRHTPDTLELLQKKLKELDAWRESVEAILDK